MDERSTSEWLCENIGAVSYNFGTETELQIGIEGRLISTGVEHMREVCLSPVDRIDFLIGRIGMEVKTRGGKSPLIRQLLRYAQSAKVDELVLVTTVPRLAAIPRELNSKPVRTLVLSACLF